MQTDQISIRAEEGQPQMSDPGLPDSSLLSCLRELGSTSLCGHLPHYDQPMWLKEWTSGGEQEPRTPLGRSRGQRLGKKAREGNGRVGSLIPL